MPAIDEVAGRVAHQLHRLDQRHAGTEQRAERTGGALDDRVAGDRADDRQRQPDAIEEAAPARRARIDEAEHHERDEADDRRDAPVAGIGGDAEDDLRRQRQLGVEFAEQPGHGRQHEHHHHHDHQHRKQDHQRRVEQGRHQPAACGGPTLHLIRDLREDRIQTPGGLAGTDHIDVETGEDAGPAAEGGRDRIAADEVVAYEEKRVAQRRIRRLLPEGLHRRDERDAGAEEDRQLAREEDQIHRAGLEERRQRAVEGKWLLLLDRRLARDPGPRRGRHCAAPRRARSRRSTPSPMHRDASDACLRTMPGRGSGPPWRGPAAAPSRRA